LGGDSGVEEVARRDSMLHPQQSQVIIGVMEDNLDLGISEYGGEWLEAGDCKGVNDRRLLPGRELQQVDAVVETMEAGRFCIDGQEGLSA
jgi:hypothetical protein